MYAGIHTLRQHLPAPIHAMIYPHAQVHAGIQTTLPVDMLGYTHPLPVACWDTHPLPGSYWDADPLVDRMTDRHVQKHYLQFEVGNKAIYMFQVTYPNHLQTDEVLFVFLQMELGK